MPLSHRRKGSKSARSKTPVVSATRLKERAAFARLSEDGE